MSRVLHVCPKCGEQGDYSDFHDSWFCAVCDEWLDEKCADQECEFCQIRPTMPSLGEI